jgi:hypothetical protein
MLFQRLNRTDAEKVFIIVKNISGGTMTANYPAVWDISSPDGIAVSKPATATLSLFVGIADADIAEQAYGLVQVYGYRASAYMTNDTSNAVVAGDTLVCIASQWYLDLTGTGGAGAGTGSFIYAAEAYATMTTPIGANKKVFIRAL